MKHLNFKKLMPTLALLCFCFWSGSAQLSVNSSGQVSIGKTNPQDDFDIAGGI